nr:non-specific lipid-transfer protein type D [Citrullus colocynthis]
MAVGACRRNIIVTWLVAVSLIVIMEGARVAAVCNTNQAEMTECKSALIGSPTKQCCVNLSKTDIKCLCQYKYMLPVLQIDEAQAMAVPGKCGIKNPCT